jgi:hypothetical protein
LQEPYDYCRNRLGLTQKNYEIWDIKDLDKFLLSSTRTRPVTEMEKIKASEETFTMIKQKIDDLIKRFSKTNNKI